MRILFVLEYFSPNIGGAETLSLNLTTGLAQKGHDCKVVTSRLPNTSRREVIDGVEIHRVAVPPFARRYWFTVCGIWRAWRMAKDCDLIQTSTYNAAIPAWLAARMRGKKIVITVYEIYGDLWNRLPGMNPIKAWPYKTFENLVIKRRFDRFVAISRYTKKCLVAEGIDEKIIDVVYPIVDYAKFDPARVNTKSVRSGLGVGREFMFTFFGRPGIAKGGEFLVRAVPEILKAIPDAKLLLILSPVPRGRHKMIKRLITELGLTEHVLLRAPVSREELPNFIAAADCVVVPSFSEGFGFTAVEAATLGIPVVIADAGSLPEVIFGKFVKIEPGNPSSIAKGVIDVSRQRTLSREPLVYGREDAINGYLRVYGEALDEKD